VVATRRDRAIGALSVLAVTVKVKAPAVVGVPVNEPVDDNVKPVGNVPALTANV